MKVDNFTYLYNKLGFLFRKKNLKRRVQTKLRKDRTKVIGLNDV